MEPFQKQAGCSHFGRSGQDPYKTRLQGAVLGSSVWDNCLPRGRHCRTSKFTRVWKCEVCNSSPASSLLLECACVATHSLPSPHLHTFFTILYHFTHHRSPHHHFTSSPLHPSPFTSSPLHPSPLHLITTSPHRTSNFTCVWKCVVCNSSFASSLLLVCACCNLCFFTISLWNSMHHHVTPSPLHTSPLHLTIHHYHRPPPLHLITLHPSPFYPI